MKLEASAGVLVAAWVIAAGAQAPAPQGPPPTHANVDYAQY